MKCPRCKSESVAKLLYGMPAFSEKLEKDLTSGKVVLGGCEIDPLFPKWRCSTCKYEFSHENDYQEPDSFDVNVTPAVEAYIKKFKCPLPDDSELRLEDANDDNEWVRVIQKAIDDDEPFEDEGVFWD